MLMKSVLFDHVRGCNKLFEVVFGSAGEPILKRNDSLIKKSMSNKMNMAMQPFNSIRSGNSTFHCL